MNPIRGIDVSYYNQPIDWKEYDGDFAFIKVSEGTVIDKIFKLQWREARGRTLRGAYHFFRVYVDPKAAANKVADYLDGDIGELPLALDLETYDGLKDTAIARAITFVEEYKRRTHGKVITYTSKGFLDPLYLKHQKELEILGQLCDYRIWLAAYPFDKIGETWSEEQRKKRLREIWQGEYMLAVPPPPYPFRRVSFHQFTGIGDPAIVGGHPLVKQAVDMNLYNGSFINYLMNEFQITYIPKEEGQEMDKTGKTIRFTNIRTTPSEGPTNDIGDLPAGSTVHIIDETLDGLGRKWYKIDNATNPSGGPILTTLNKAVSETPCWCYGNNIEIVNIPGQSAKIVKSVIHFDDGSTTELFPHETNPPV